jgi:hypothetical protein
MKCEYIKYCFVALGWFCLFLSCKSFPNKNETKINNLGKHLTSDTVKAKVFNKLVICDLDTTDSPIMSWVGGGVYSLSFEKGKLYYSYNPQCVYWYPIECKNNKMIMYWDYNEDCVFNRGLKKTYGLSKYPRKGTPFASFNLVNDSTLNVEYYYPEWVKKINETEEKENAVFPEKFIRTPFH